MLTQDVKIIKLWIGKVEEGEVLDSFGLREEDPWLEGLLSENPECSPGVARLNYPVGLDGFGPLQPKQVAMITNLEYWLWWKQGGTAEYSFRP